jgi:2,3-bisphosphoglycerate-independent phosphoglycerate mutase
VRVMMLFLDGVGIGRRDGSVNPFFASRLPALRWLLCGPLPSLRHREISNHRATLLPLDATLGIEGLPQSGTGQTALFTGLNGAKLIGRHFGPFPYSSLKPVIEEQNIFRQLKAVRKRPYFANAFPQRFFDYVSQHRSRLTVTTLSCVMSGIPLLRYEDLRAGRGISADITNRAWTDIGYPDLERIEPEEAGRRLARLSKEYDFVLFEYWKTDHAGHSKSMETAIEVLELFDAMLAGILDLLDTHRTLLFVTSDHGNIEDMSTKSHTRHPVPVIMYGRDHERLASRLSQSRKGPLADLTLVTPCLMEYITGTPAHPAR